MNKLKYLISFITLVVSFGILLPGAIKKFHFTYEAIAFGASNSYLDIKVSGWVIAVIITMIVGFWLSERNPFLFDGIKQPALRNTLLRILGLVGYFGGIIYFSITCYNTFWARLYTKYSSFGGEVISDGRYEAHMIAAGIIFTLAVFLSCRKRHNYLECNSSKSVGKL